MSDPLRRNLPPHPSLLKDPSRPAQERLGGRGSSAPALPGTPACKSLLKALEAPFAIVDLETTGLSPSRDEIIEIGALLVDWRSRSVREFSTLIKPSIALPPKTTQITGIDQAMLDEHGIGLRAGFTRLQAFIGDRPVFAHHAEFDQGFLVNASARLGLGFPNVMYDTICMAEAAWPSLDSYALFSLAQRMGLGNSPAHRALADARATLDVLIEADRVLRGTSDWPCRKRR
ncbi:MAG: 3'-5' exonuclease [Thiobacillus sp.]|nr:3'-5' exonuclease [Thiobacillus sp.]